MKTKTKVTALALLLAATTACGSSDEPAVKSNNTANNTENNQNNENNESNDPNNSTNNVAPNNVTPDGLVELVSPAGNVTTNGVVTLVFELGEDVESAEILVDGNADGELSGPVYELDTASLTEELHIIGIQYTVDGETRSADVLEILVDRTAPTLTASTPTDGETGVRNSGPVRLTFSEAINPDSLGEASIQIGGQSPTVWIDDGGDVLVDFDWAALQLPYDATLDYSGLEDGAGNAASGSISWTVPQYLSEPAGDLTNPFWYMADGDEVIIGSRGTATGGEIVAMRSQLADDGHKDWVIIESMGFSEVVDFDVAVHNGTAYLSAVLRTAPNGTVSTRLSLFSLEPGATEFKDQGTRVYPADPAAEYTTSIAAGPAKLHIGLMSVEDGVHDVFTVNHVGMLAFVIPDLMPVMFTNMYEGTMKLEASSTDSPLMTFARCTTASAPCTQWEIISLEHDGTTWQAMTTTTLRSSLIASAPCDRFNGFDTLVDGDDVYLMVSSAASCRSGASRDFDLYLAGTDEWTPVATDIASTMGLPSTDYATRMVAAPGGGLLFVAQASDLLAMGEFSGASVTSLGELTNGFDTSSGEFENTRISTDGTAPIVSTSFGGSTLLWRNN